jgi:2-oxoglutarate ferredoxin oxidoreductase subunit delta
MNLALKVVAYETDKGTFYLFPGLCKGCGLCKEKCPTGVLVWSDTLGAYSTPTVSPTNPDAVCRTCGICQNVCPDCAILVQRKGKEEK